MNRMQVFTFYIVFTVIWALPFLFGIYGSIQLFRLAKRQDFIIGLASVLTSALSAAGIVWFSVSFFKQYGYALFIGLPIYCGIIPVVIYAYRKPRSYWEAVGISGLTVIALGIAIIAFALDGLICILMAAPLALLFTFTSAFVTNLIMRSRHKTLNITPILLACGSLPIMVGFESRCDLPPPTSVVVTTVDVNASADRIWKFIPAIPIIPEKPEVIFRSGLAYPVKSEMEGEGLGAHRLCILTTGPLKEIVTVWQPGRILRFTVTSCPPSMHEMSIYRNLQTAHLENFMVSEWGQFKLIPIDSEHTRLEGTSQYHNRMWPSQYWLAISDWIVHRIHLRVLNFIKREAEKKSI